MDRPRLVERLSSSVHRPVTVVSAPPGAGKTYAVAAWARAGSASGRIAWLTVDEGDDAPGVFWAYVIQSLRLHDVPLDDDLQMPARPDAVDRSLLARLAAAVADLAEPVILVLDQIDVAASGEVSAGLDFVLRHTGSNLRLLITTRADPVIPLHRYRLSDELVEIGREELAFTHEEAAALFARHRSDSATALSLSPEAVSILLARTEGWAGGLRLSALALRQVEDPERFVRDLRRSDDTIADYLRAEVLDALPVHTRDLLQRVSVLERIHPDLADQLTGRDDASWVLRDLAKANAFIERIENTGQWYRCHPMFAEALRDQLNIRQPGLESELHRRAARWLAEAGRLTDCLRHAAVVEDWDLAATQLVERFAVGDLLGGRDTHRLTAQFAKMPRHQTVSAAAALVSAALATAEPDPHLCLTQLDHAARLTDDLPAARQPAYRLGIALVRVAISRLLGDLAAAQTAATAALDLPVRRLAECPDPSALILANLGAAQLWAGQLDLADCTLHQAVEAGGAPGLEHVRHSSLGQLALLYLLRGQLRQARQCALEAVGVADRSGIPVAYHSGAGRTALASVALERNDAKTAHTHLRDALATADALQDPLVVVELALTRARIDRAKGHNDTALQTLRCAAEWSRQRCDPAWVASRLLVEQVRTHLSNRDLTAAQECVDRMGAGPERLLAMARIHLSAASPEAALETLAGFGPTSDQVYGDVRIQAQLLRAQAALAMRDDQTALRAIGCAFELAGPDDCRRAFLDAGVWLRQVLSRSTDLTEVRRWLVGGRPVPRSGPQRPTGGVEDGPPGVVTESLSRREREVLGLLAQGFTAQEIGSELYVSVNTVKTHLKGIYRKLSASRRREAVRYARQLNLI